MRGVVLLLPLYAFHDVDRDNFSFTFILTGSILIVPRLNNSTEQSRIWEANSFLASQDIALVLCNLKFHYRIDNSPPLVATLNHIN
jgi:hypothetical protein